MLLLSLSLSVENRGRGDRNPSAIPDDIYDVMIKLTKGKTLLPSDNDVCVCVCILNWPLPIGAFQDQCKQ